MINSIIILLASAILISGCTSSEKQPVTLIKESPPKAAQKEVTLPKKVELPKTGRKAEGARLCKNIKRLKKGMSLEEVHNRLGFGKNKKYAFTKPIFYIKCYEEDMIISYAEYKFFFSEGCTFKKVYEPAEKEVEEMICSGRSGELPPPEIFKY